MIRRRMVETRKSQAIFFSAVLMFSRHCSKGCIGLDRTLIGISMPGRTLHPVNLTTVFVMSCHHHQEQGVLLDIQSHFCFHENDHSRDSRRILFKESIFRLVGSNYGSILHV